MSTFVELDSIYRDRVQDPNPCNFTLPVSLVSSWLRAAREVRSSPQNQATRPLEFVTTVNMTALTLPYPRVDLYADTFITVTDISSAGTTFTATEDTNFSVGDRIRATSSTNGVVIGTNYYVYTTPTSTTFTLDLITPPAAAHVFTPGSDINLVFALYTDDVETLLTSALEIIKYPRLYVDYHTVTFDDAYLINTISGIHANTRFIVVPEKVQFDDRLTPIWIYYKSLMEQTLRIKRDEPVHFSIRSRNDEIITAFTDLDLDVPADPYKQVIATFTLTPYIRDNDYANSLLEPIPTS